MSRTLCFVSVEILPVESKDSASVVTIDLVSDDDDHNDIPLKKTRLKKRQFLTFFREKRPTSDVNFEMDSEERENPPTHDQGI